MNELYDGHEIAGKNLAKTKYESVEYPHLPLGWLTQIDTFAQIINHDLLHVGFLGRIDYFFDLEKRMELSSMEEGFHEKPFSKKLLKRIGKFLEWYCDFKQQKAVMGPFVHEILKEWEYDNFLNKGLDENYIKFLRRIVMSAEKRLTVYAVFNAFEQGRTKQPIITEDMVMAHLKMIDYQLIIRRHIYNEELSGNDTYKAVRNVFLAVKDKKKTYKGYILWTDFYSSFKNKYRNRFPELLQARNMLNEIKSLQSLGHLRLEEFEDKPGRYLKCLI